MPNRLVRAITNPNFSALLPSPKDPDPNAKRLEDYKFARAMAAQNVDFFGPVQQGQVRPELPPADSPIFAINQDILAQVEDKLPRNHVLRSLQRDDYDRGYASLKGVGPILANVWNERCEYLRQRNDCYAVVVVIDPEDRVVASGTLLVVRRFTHGASLVGHIEDLSVAEGQSGKNLGLRVFEALDRIAKDMGCYKTTVTCQEANEGFHQQKGYRKSGIEMTHHYVPTLKKRVTDDGAASRNASPRRIERERKATEELLDGTSALKDQYELQA
ncbi:Glucosamine-phosphate N-acetyltransferase-like protein [Taxawa tesnikishii (nom. ined.)]|nr:Glucosamine-phosphate N-acetyltransferase-like protein [Dothideales sp. JES 119]